MSDGCAIHRQQGSGMPILSASERLNALSNVPRRMHRADIHLAVFTYLPGVVYGCRWTNLVVICVECRRYAARWLCDDCEEVYCVGCYASVHRHGTKVSENRTRCRRDVWKHGWTNTRDGVSKAVDFAWLNTSSPLASFILCFNNRASQLQVIVHGVDEHVALLLCALAARINRGLASIRKHCWKCEKRRDCQRNIQGYQTTC